MHVTKEIEKANVLFVKGTNILEADAHGSLHYEINAFDWFEQF